MYVISLILFHFCALPFYPLCLSFFVQTPQVRKELQNNRRHQNRIRDKLSKEEQRLSELGKSMDAKDRKKYDDILHDLEEKKMALEEKRKKINENEKVWQRECRELKKMQLWSKPGVPAQGGAWGPPPPAQQGVPPPLNGGDTKPSASQTMVDDAKNAADYAVARAEAELAANFGSKASSKSKEEGGGGKESKKRKSSSRSSSRSKRKSRSADAEVDVDTAAV